VTNDRIEMTRRLGGNKQNNAWFDTEKLDGANSDWVN
jgi:hypothetical protein